MKANLCVLLLYAAAAAAVLATDHWSPPNTALGRLARGKPEHARPDTPGEPDTPVAPVWPDSRVAPETREEETTETRTAGFVLREAKVVTRASTPMADERVRSVDPKGAYEFDVKSGPVRLTARVNCPTVLRFGSAAATGSVASLTADAQFVLDFDLALEREGRLMTTYGIELPVPDGLKPLVATTEPTDTTNAPGSHGRSTDLAVTPERATRYARDTGLTVEPRTMAITVARSDLLTSRKTSSLQSGTVLDIGRGTGCLRAGPALEVRIQCEVRALTESLSLQVVLLYERSP